ncbi:sigma-70 family RNA polymerase sigma factor [Geosporobacter ferrireducens]|uniref:RNA polymerase subunit sigma-24 n=1 Tax=Geosporobacter ferrireducens TaxID=1424294 RepID=A0A1D8GJ36_9FIRM|nr:sigma-70 family RNA polymerase sigma factor [Geosporobacter ferrireducens]AOT70929.1 hypothetical protein Gferi_15985 [Geosporobacter ferrireducens]MTI53640.1 sigma-70 family RNA polymerase sigma factor [Geosporobacter ferrireducens]
MQDIELLNECKKNPEQGLEYVIEQYVDLIYTIVYGKISTVGTTEDAKECVSDVFMAFYQQIDRINLDKGSVKVYLAMIAHHKAVDLYRKLVRVASNIGINGELMEYQDCKTDLEHDMLKKEEKKVLLQAIDSLGEPDKEIFVRRYYLGQKTKEIADALNLRDNTVDKKISRGLKKLKFLLGGVQYGREENLLAK